MVSSLEQLAFTEAVRACTQQQAVLEALRTRMIAVGGAAAVTIGLAGDFANRSAHPAWTFAVFSCLAVILAATGYVLWPRQWKFSNNVTGLVAEAPTIDAERRDAELSVYLLSWADDMQAAWDTQNGRLHRMGTAYSVAVAALIVLLMFWTGRSLL